MSIDESKSEIARLRHQIEQEIAAMQQGMYGLATGTARHEFIRVRMESLGQYQDTLAEHVGDAEANAILCQTYAAVIG